MRRRVTGATRTARCRPASTRPRSSSGPGSAGDVSWQDGLTEGADSPFRGRPLPADRATYDTLLGLARKTMQTDERVRYYNAAASASNPEFAKETLAIVLTDEITPSMVGGIIFAVAGPGEHPELAVEFVRANFSTLAARQGPSFRNNVFATLMTNFTDPAHAAELAAFAPAHETSGGRIMSERAQERILADADFAERQLPAIDEWIRQRNSRP